jgi:xanthine dehydrogenase small subunit
MREKIIFYLNHERVELTGSDAFLPLSSWLRLRKGMTGTKVVCSEGDCGACTVILGWMVGESGDLQSKSPDRTMDTGGNLSYRIIDSCIQFLFQLDCCHVITVEALAESGKLHPAQQAMVECFGSQCGFCTPGFVMALAHLAEERRSIDTAAIKEKLTGNLCRCTGYEAIVKAGLTLNGRPAPGLLARFDTKAMETEFRALVKQTLKVTGDGEQVFFKPKDLTEALKLKQAMPQLKVLAGGTDLGVQHNKGRAPLVQVMFIAHLHEIGQIRKSAEYLDIGAVTNWTDLWHITKKKIPAFHDILSIFAAEQIRNAATIGGNIINASPIADSLPGLFVLGARLVLSSLRGDRQVDIRQFYTGYKKFDMQPDELLTRIILPLPKPGYQLGLYKVSKRRDLDISTATLGIYLGVEQGKITEAHVAVGGVAATVIALSTVERDLMGKPLNEATLAAAGIKAATEITPLSDVRGSAGFRKALVRNLFLKFWHENQAATVSKAG